MSGIPSQEYSSITILVSYQGMSGPGLGRHHLNLSMTTKHSLNGLYWIHTIPLLLITQHQMISKRGATIPVQYESSVISVEREKDVSLPKLMTIFKVWRTKIN